VQSSLTTLDSLWQNPAWPPGGLPARLRSLWVRSTGKASPPRNTMCEPCRYSPPYVGEYPCACTTKALQDVLYPGHHEVEPPGPPKTSLGTSRAHVWHLCTRPHCPICVQGPILCVLCGGHGGSESSLPTECPGLTMSPRRAAEVKAGAWDYINGRWAPTMEKIP
jgi:hypothetical protein